RGRADDFHLTGIVQQSGQVLGSQRFVFNDDGTDPNPHSIESLSRRQLTRCLRRPRLTMRSQPRTIAECAKSPWCLLQAHSTPPAETSAQTILATAGVIAPARVPRGALQRKYVRLPSRARLARHRYAQLQPTSYRTGQKTHTPRPRGW